nr:hypothetical protein [Rhizobium sullae]
MMAMAALLKNFMSDLKYRFFNDIYSLEVSIGNFPALQSPLMQNLCGLSGVEYSQFPEIEPTRALSRKWPPSALQFAPASVNQLSKSCNTTRATPREE